MFDRSTGSVVNKFKGHTKKVLAVAAHPTEPIVISAGADKSIRVHDYTQKKTTAIIKAVHKQDITALALHPTNTLVVSVSSDGSWAVTDLTSQEILMQEQGADALTQCAFHPDGLYLATGAATGKVSIWDLEKQTVAAEFEGHAEAISTMAFSEGGRYFATADRAGVVKVWDLKKLKTLHTITVEGTNSITFDPSGQLLVVAGQDIRCASLSFFSFFFSCSGSIALSVPFCSFKLYFCALLYAMF